MTSKIRFRSLCFAALAAVAACAPTQTGTWERRQPSPREMVYLRANMAEIERVAALTDAQVQMELQTGRRQTPATGGAPRRLPPAPVASSPAAQNRRL